MGFYLGPKLHFHVARGENDRKKKRPKHVKKFGIKFASGKIHVFTKARSPRRILGGKVVIPAFFPAVAPRFSIGRPQNYRMHARGEGGRESGHTCASAEMNVFLASGISYEYLWTTISTWARWMESTFLLSVSLLPLFLPFLSFTLPPPLSLA